ncbi:MAG: OmpA family protein [Proteobacteria bacterium]|nr:OmpA family protein [Pseudomonadota bacterium]
MHEHTEEHEEEEGEGWLISYADMVTLLFGLFVILYSLSNVEDKKFAEFGKSIAAGFKGGSANMSIDGQPEMSLMLSDEQQQMRAFQMLVAILNLGDPNSAVRKVAKAYEDHMDKKGTSQLTTQLLKNTDAVKVKAEIQNASKDYDQRLTEIVIPSDQLFAKKSSVLLPSAPRILDSIASVLLRVIDSVEVQIESHTDQADFLSTEVLASYMLSSSQANAIAVYFINKGLPMARVSSVGRGHSIPIMGNGTNFDKSKGDAKLDNRRIQINIGKK